MSRVLAAEKLWSRPDVASAARRASLALVAAWGLLHVGLYTHSQVSDIPVYKKYGDWMASGLVPYRDFGVEYPPGALPAFVTPSLLDGRASYRAVFELLMLACALALVVFTALALRSLRAPPYPPLAFVSLAWLALGSVVLTRYDLYAAAVTAAAVAALLSGRLRLGSGVLGLATAVKVYPLVILPLVLAVAWRRGGKRAVAACAGWFAGATAAVVLPFFVLAPGGVLDALGRQLSRPLQIESLGSSFLLAAHHAFGLEIAMRSGSGSQNLVGTLPDVLAGVQAALLVGVLVGLWVAFARGSADPARVARYAAACVVAFVALGKVLSPQFLIWLVPLVPLVRGRRGLAAGGLLAVALVLTQLWFPFRYWRLALGFDELASWLVLARDLSLVALLGVLSWPEKELL
jgi:glycosyl transferase family 87